MVASLRQQIGIAALALLIVISLAPQRVAEAAGERCFPETGYCIAGPIRAYWERNGGLSVFGYPISDQVIDTIEGTWTGPTQWFERDRLEDHSDEGVGVLAGRLGAQLLEARGTPWQTFPGAPGPGGPQCRYFPETAHILCPPFLGYWEGNGGLARFGYPITERFEESLEGRVYTIQYFERRRLEYHPENAGTHYEVLLGLLGRDLYNPQSNGLQGLRDALTEYFGSLASGQYAAAARRYGGDYQMLRDWNPDVDPNDHARLLERSCTQNGLQCLPVRRIVAQRRLTADTYRFTVEFLARDGSVFTSQGRSQFDYTLRTPVDGPITIQELPPYVA